MMKRTLTVTLLTVLAAGIIVMADGGTVFAKSAKAAKSKPPAAKLSDPAKWEVTTPEQASTDGKVHAVMGGDTLWGISGSYWKDLYSWPKLWSFNPHIRNPHWIFPGEKVFLSAQPLPAAEPPKEREVTLVVEKLVPPEAAKETPAAQAAKEPAKAEPPKRYYMFAERATQDYIAPAKENRLGSVKNETAEKIMTAESEELEFTVASGKTVSVGDKLTLFNDDREIESPVDGKLMGFQVHVLGHLSVTKVDGSKAWGKVFSSYDVIEDGSGLMNFRQPVKKIEKAAAPAGISGMVLAGDSPITLFGSDNVVFLDKGKADGLVPGALVAVPYPVGPTAAEGYTDLMQKPIARAVIVSAENSTSTAWVMESRKAIEMGYRFVAAADSP